jgi:hypothetical protein
MEIFIHQLDKDDILNDIHVVIDNNSLFFYNYFSSNYILDWLGQIHLTKIHPTIKQGLFVK